MAKLGIVIDDWMAANSLDATALQCWTSMQQNYGINVCTLMSMMSEQLMPSACEVDVTGVLSMYALQLASGTPSALVDWNNNYGDDPDKCVLFHCGNWAKSFFAEVKMANAEILATTLGHGEHLWRAGRARAGRADDAMRASRPMTGRAGSGPMSARASSPTIRSRPSAAGRWSRCPACKQLMRYICKNGFEHHVAMNASHTAAILAEAFETYLGWNVYCHAAKAG